MQFDEEWKPTRLSAWILGIATRVTQHRYPRSMLAAIVPDLDPRDLQIAAATVLESIRRKDSPLRAIGDALGELAARVGADHAVLGIDDERLGRQVFCSNRAPLDSNTGPIFGPASLVTSPPMAIDPAGERLLIAAAELAFSSLHHRLDGAEPRIGRHLRIRLAAAVAAASQFGWGFAFVLAQCDTAHAFNDGTATVPDDANETYRLDDRELAFILPATRSADIPTKLGHIAQRRGLPTMTFGVAMCPADGTDANSLLVAAATRLKETLETRTISPDSPTTHTVLTVPSAS